MKKNFVLFFCVLFLSCATYTSIGQQLPLTKISEIKTEANNNVAIVLTSDKKFIFGGNRYVLHIGNQEFMRSRQIFENGKGVLTFIIPKGEFDKLEEGKSCYLTYGNMEDGEYLLEELAKQEYPTCWSLGKFNKHLSTK